MEWKKILNQFQKQFQIIDILNQYRTEPLDDSWWPIAVFSSFTDKDNTTILSWDGAYGITYRDDELNKEETIDLRVRRDHVPYDVWQNQGYFNVTEGNVIHQLRMVEGLLDSEIGYLAL